MRQILYLKNSFFTIKKRIFAHKLKSKYMKKISLILAAIIFTCFTVVGQMVSPVTWKYSVKRISATEAEIQMNATIENGWHLYAINSGDGFELPLEISFTPSNDYQLTGKIKEPKAHTTYDSTFGTHSNYFTKKATFTQKIKITDPAKSFKVKGKLSGQACIEGRCTQIKDDFTISVNGEGAEEDKAESEAESSVSDTNSTQPDTAVIKQAENTDIQSNSNSEKEESMFWFFLTSIGAGLIGLLMPCVFPMIPMTVSYFMKSGKKGKFHALFYGFSIVLIFVIFGIVLSAILGPGFANILSTHWIPNILFAVIFIVFALSMFGYFEITLPSSWVNKSAKNENRGGLLGVFFMALTLVLVSFSCTLPIAGAVALNAAGGSFLKPIIGMLGFSLGIAVPFTLFALFPGLLKKAPKSGGWMNTLKVILAFVELAFALKFLNVPDQTYHWGLLDREVYLAFWIVLFTMLGFYLVGKLRFPADDEMPIQKNPLRFVTSIFVFTFVIYMIPGMFGAPLNAISGWLPQVETQDFDINRIVREEGRIQAVETETAKYSDKLSLPHGIEGYFDYDQALRVAKATNKPVFIDFTGHGCMNCRQVEANVWRDIKVRQKFANDFVVLAMYVDDKTVKLDKEDYIKDADGNDITMLGEKCMYISQNKYHENSQPCYFILDTDGSVLAGPTYYELDINKYMQFLDNGISEFKKRHAK